MKLELREVRAMLKRSTRTEFENIVYDAMLTPFQEKVLRMHICDNLSIGVISELLGYSDSGVRKLLRQVYEKVAKL